MSQNQTSNATPTKQAPAQDNDVAARLKAISAALAAKNPELAAAPRAAMTCPIDPAERAACDSCQ